MFATEVLESVVVDGGKAPDGRSSMLSGTEQERTAAGSGR
jgi:hypothetical protein